MCLTMETEHAIRAMLYLTLVDRTASASEMSKKVRIQKRHLNPAFKKLKNAGLVNTYGEDTDSWCLTRPPEEITLLDIIRVTENVPQVLNCMYIPSVCNFCGPTGCTIYKCFSDLQDEIENLYAGVTLRALADRTQNDKNSFRQYMALQPQMEDGNDG